MNAGKPIIAIRTSTHAFQYSRNKHSAYAKYESEDLRRLFVNACHWLTGAEVPKKADVTYVGEFKPTFFGFNKARKGVKPAEHELRQ